MQYFYGLKEHVYLHNGKYFSYTEWLRVAIHLSGWMNKKIVLFIIHIFLKMAFMNYERKTAQSQPVASGLLCGNSSFFCWLKQKIDLILNENKADKYITCLLSSYYFSFFSPFLNHLSELYI